MRFDCVIGNPPFNLQWWVEEKTEVLSQLYYCTKAAELLKPMGILALIVPTSFLADDFMDGGMIKEMQKHYHFLGQVGLPETAFSSMGVAQFATKIQYWQRKSDIDAVADKSYTTAISHSICRGFDCDVEAEMIFTSILQGAKESLQRNRTKLFLELARRRETSSDFQYQVQKMLYQINVHPVLKSKHTKCYEYVHRFYTERQPDAMKYDEWVRVRLTEAKVLSYLRQTLKRQHPRPSRDEIKLVKRDYDFVYKGYSAKVRRQMSENMKVPKPIYRAVVAGEVEQFPGFERLLRKQKRDSQVQEQPLADMTPDAKMAQWITDLSLWAAENADGRKLK